MLGRALGLPEPVLEQIEEDERNLFDKCFSKYKLLIDQLTVGRVKVKSSTIVRIGTPSSSPSSAYLLSMKRVGNPVDEKYGSRFPERGLCLVLRACTPYKFPSLSPSLPPPLSRGITLKFYFT